MNRIGLNRVGGSQRNHGHIQRAVAAAISSAALYTSTSLAQQDWIQFIDHTCRIDPAGSIVNDAPCDSDICLAECPSGCEMCSSSHPACCACCACEEDIAFDDLDRDGDTDMVIVRKVPFSNQGGRANVLLMNENGMMVDRTAELAPRFTDLTDDRDVVIEDVDPNLLDTSKNMPDVITAGTFGEPPRVYINLGCCNTACTPNCPKVRCDDQTATPVWCGLQLKVGAIPALPPPFFCAVAGGDVNGDGCDDLYFASYIDRRTDPTCMTRVQDRLLFNGKDVNGVCTGQFVDVTEDPPDRLCPGGSCFNDSVFGTSAQIVDVNGDGFNDIVKVTANPCQNMASVLVLYNDPAAPGSFKSQQNLTQDPGFQADPYMFVAGDLNKNLQTDVYVVKDNGDVFLINTSMGAGTPVPFDVRGVQTPTPTSGFGGNVRLADLDGDTFPDVAVSDVDVDIAGCDRTLALLRTQVDPMDQLNVTISDPFLGQKPWNTLGTYDTGIFDVNGDMKPDLWSGTCSGNKLFIQGTIHDCNDNQISDICDITAGTSMDPNGNGIPDECEVGKNRYIPLIPQTPDVFVAYQVTLVRPAPEESVVLGWLTPPGPGRVSRVSADPAFRFWTEPVIDIGDCEIVPGATYEIRRTTDGVSFPDPPIVLQTVPIWGDVVGLENGAWTPPDGVVNILDILAAVDRFVNAPGAPPKTWVDVRGTGQPEVPDFNVTILDILQLVKAFVGVPYPFPPPTLCSGGGSALASATAPASFTLVANSELIAPGQGVNVDVFVSSVPDLAGYQVALGVTGGTAGTLTLTDVTINETRPDYVFGTASNVEAIDVTGRRMGNGLMSGTGVPVTGPGYLATFFYVPSAGATGVFHVAVKGGEESLLADSNVQQIPSEPGGCTASGWAWTA